MEERGGFDVEFVGNKPHNVDCSICLMVFRKPMQAEQCGHRFCRSCIEDVKDGDGIIICPEDRTAINVFQDKAKEREILNATVKCTNNGCPVTKELRDLEGHIEVCAYQLIPCPVETCEERIQRQFLENHKKTNHVEDRMDQIENTLTLALQKIEDQNKVIEAQAREINQLKENINPHQQQQVFCSSYNWKVYQFDKNFDEAKENYDNEPITRRFYTTEGYCIKTELFLNGSEVDWGRRVTIHFSVEPGAFDNTLKWPMACIFSASILFNGLDVGRNSFDTKRISKRIRHIFKRPPNGLPNWYSLHLVSVEQLEQFCVDDSIRIKIDISHY